MKYIYPKLSKNDLSFVRLGGSGLGNLLFTYSRALILSKKHNLSMIFPTWKSIKIGPYLRREKDKRFYGDLFKNNSGYIGGLKKVFLLLFSNKISYKNIDNIKDNQIAVYDEFIMNFDGLLPYRDMIREDLIKNLNKKNKKALEYDFGNSVLIHIRLGDFAKANAEKLSSGANNLSIPVKWYADILSEIRKTLGKDVKAYVFSDGSDEELSEILKLKNVSRISFGTSIADIMALSRAKVMISSGSSFSLWARYLGNCSSVSYPNQIKERVLTDENGFEIETYASFDSETEEKIKNILG